MGDVINLNKYRKKLRKEAESQKTAVNRVSFGRLKADKDLVTARLAKEDHELSLTKIETIPFEKPDDHHEDDESDPA
jgi:hypothetical protein